MICIIIKFYSKQIYSINKISGQLPALPVKPVGEDASCAAGRPMRPREGKLPPWAAACQWLLAACTPQTNLTLCTQQWQLDTACTGHFVHTASTHLNASWVFSVPKVICQSEDEREQNEREVGDWVGEGPGWHWCGGIYAYKCSKSTFH